MKKYTSHRSGLFLMEIIIAILFFSVVSAICLQLFVKSRTISQDTRTHDMAVNEASSVAAILQSGDDAADNLEKLYPNLTASGDTITIYYDSQYSPCGKDDAAYCITITPEKNADRYTSFQIDYNSIEKEETIYTLTVDNYQPVTP